MIAQNHCRRRWECIWGREIAGVRPSGEESGNEVNDKATFVPHENVGELGQIHRSILFSFQSLEVWNPGWNQLVREKIFSTGTAVRDASDMVMVMVALSEALTSSSNCEFCHEFIENPYKEPSSCGTEPSLEETTGEGRKKSGLLSCIR